MRLTKEELQALVDKQTAEIESLKQQLEATKPLQEQNQQLKDYVQMANEESQGLSLELSKTQRLLQESYESMQTLLQSLDATTKVHLKNLESATNDYMQSSKKLFGGRK